MRDTETEALQPDREAYSGDEQALTQHREFFDVLQCNDTAFRQTIASSVPDALWRLAILPIQSRRPVGDTMLDAATAYLSGERAANIVQDALWRNVLADVEVAHAIYAGDALDRAILEARILSRQTHSEIADRCGLSLGAIATYEALFFDVRGRLGAEIWVNCHAIAIPTDGSAPAIGAVLRKLGFFGGEVVLEAIVPIALKSRGKDVLDYTIDVDTESGRTELSGRIMLAVELLPQNETTARYFVNEHLQQLRRDIELRRLGVAPDIDIALEQHHLAATLARLKELSSELQCSHGQDIRRLA